MFSTCVSDSTWHDTDSLHRWDTWTIATKQLSRPTWHLRGECECVCACLHSSMAKILVALSDWIGIFSDISAPLCNLFWQRFVHRLKESWRLFKGTHSFSADRYLSLMKHPSLFIRLCHICMNTFTNDALLLIGAINLFLQCNSSLVLFCFLYSEPEETSNPKKLCITNIRGKLKFWFPVCWDYYSVQHKGKQNHSTHMHIQQQECCCWSSMPHTCTRKHTQNNSLQKSYRTI